MKKIFTYVILAMAATSGYAQSNLFDAADVDADGWIWFDTDEKINKYVGNAIDKQDANGFDWEKYSVNPNGKPIQLAFADISPDYTASIANAYIPGTDAGGYVEGQDKYVEGERKTGAIMLAPASAMMIANGGCLILNLPSCESISLYMSSESSYMGRTLLLTPGYAINKDDATGDPWTGHTKVIYAKASIFSTLHGAGQFKWEGIETLNNGNNSGVTFKSNSPVYFAFQNCRNAAIYIHGMKVTIGTATGIKSVSASNGAAEYYTIGGNKVQQPVHGLTIVRQNGVTRKVVK